MSAAAPLRGATRPEGGGFAATVFPGSPRRVRGRSSGLKGAAHRAGARQPCGLPWTPETSAAPGGRKSGQARACPRRARRATPRGGGRTRAPRTPGKQIELAFDTQKERKNYTNPLLGSLHTSRGLPELLPPLVYAGLAHREHLMRCRCLAVRDPGELDVLVHGQVDHLAGCPGRSRQPAQGRPFIAAPEPVSSTTLVPRLSACRATERSRPSSTKRLPSAIGSPNSGIIQ